MYVFKRSILIGDLIFQAKTEQLATVKVTRVDYTRLCIVFRNFTSSQYGVAEYVTRPRGAHCARPDTLQASAGTRARSAIRRHGGAVDDVAIYYIFIYMYTNVVRQRPNYYVNEIHKCISLTYR